LTVSSLQVVSELKATPYRPVTTILAAKRHYCVNEGVCMSKTVPVEDGCDILRDSSQGCKFDKGSRSLALHVQKRFDLRVCLKLLDILTKCYVMDTTHMQHACVLCMLALL
jgi:hypothetical protein